MQQRWVHRAFGYSTCSHRCVWLGCRVIATTGLEGMLSYVKLLVVLIGCMIFIALVVNPLLVWFYTRTRSLWFGCAWGKAALQLSSPVHLPLTFRSIWIFAVNSTSTRTFTLFPSLAQLLTWPALLSLLQFWLWLPLLHWTFMLISERLSCFPWLLPFVRAAHPVYLAVLFSLFHWLAACSGIEQNVAMQVVAVGFVIGVLQDSAETALNSSTDVLFTAAACEYNQRKEASVH